MHAHSVLYMYAARRASGPAAVRSALFERSLPVRMNMNVCVFVVSWTPGADPRLLTYMVYSTVCVVRVVALVGREAQVLSHNPSDRSPKFLM